MAGEIAELWAKDMGRKVDGLDDLLRHLEDRAKEIESDPLVPSGAKDSARTLRAALAEHRNLVANMREGLRPTNGKKPAVHETVDQDRVDAIRVLKEEPE